VTLSPPGDARCQRGRDCG